ncbi:hypothetical protein GCM10023314_15700 [Algibacter agarivorans]|uniref:Dolichyl-phosphate-mannose-protein mannosyltransferase n=1 Tax=Algibacter agarivorans TaxID=1109741 RepID=A0ABP9GI41_9FLAO
MLKRINYYINNHTLKALFFSLIILRLIVLFLYGSVTIFPDSKAYIALGNRLLELNLTDYSGRRTPGFPFLIAISNNILGITVAIQLILGVIGSYFFYDLVRLKTHLKTFAFTATLCLNLFIHFIFFEFAILTEALSVFLIILMFWYIERYKLLKFDTPVKHYFIISFIFSWLYLIKPFYIYFPVGFTLFYIVNIIINKKTKTDLLLKSICILIVPLVSYYSWNMVNKKNTGYFNNTFYLGLNLSQLATTFFDKAPEEDKLIRDIFVKHRDSINKVKPFDLPMSVWYAYDELLEKTRLSEQDLCNELGRISKNLFKNHPDLYVKQAIISWTLFWGYGETLLINREKFNSEYFKFFILIIWNGFIKYLLILFYVLFLLFSIKKLFLFFKSKCIVYDFDLLVICIVLCGSIAQALVVYGSNSRYAFPYLPLIVYFVLVKLNRLKSIKNINYV